MLKKLTVHMRKTIKFIILAIISIFLIVGAVVFIYKPTYSVSINGEHVGYTENKGALQEKINNYIENGEGENVAFVQVENLPEYRLCLLKKGIETNDEEIFNNIKEKGVTYYRYYAVADNNEEKSYVSSFEEAETIVNQLKEKESSNIDNITIVEKYETEKKDFTDTETAVAGLFVEKPKPVLTVAEKSGKVDTSASFGKGTTSLGISLIRPVSGIITSRFGVSSRIRKSNHTGLDISASIGTPVAAAAAGTVTFAGWKGSYGNMLVISHGNGIQTYYCHCSRLMASVGQTVAQGQTVAAVGSTGNSTGPHLHIEVRVNGVAYNPENYLY